MSVLLLYLPSLAHSSPALQKTLPLDSECPENFQYLVYLCVYCLFCSCERRSNFHRQNKLYCRKKNKSMSFPQSFIHRTEFLSNRNTLIDLYMHKNNYEYLHASPSKKLHFANYMLRFLLF